MADYPPKKNAAFTFYVSLISQANTKIAQDNPTLAAGDVKVAVDDGAPANLGTLPVVDADFTKRVKVVLTAGEMNGDNISIIFSDAAGAEWCDLMINIPTVTQQLVDLATSAAQTTAQNDLDILTGADGAIIASGTQTYNMTGSITGNLSGSVGSVTGHTPQTGDSYARLGAPAGASVSADIAAVKSDSAAILTDTGTTLDTKINDIQGATFSSATDSLEALRNRGDAAWTTATGFSTLSAAQVNAEVVDALNTDTYAEPTGAPAATVSLVQKIGYLYMALRNKLTVTSTTKTFFDDGGTAEWTKALSDDGTTYTEGEGA